MVFCENLKIIQTLINEPVENNIDVSCLKDGYHFYEDHYLIRLFYNALLFNVLCFCNTLIINNVKDYHIYDSGWYELTKNNKVSLYNSKDELITDYL